MKFADDFLTQAQTAVLGVLRDVQPSLQEKYGAAEFSTKGDKTVVTELDMMVEERLRVVLRSLDAGIGIVGEEQGAEGNTETYWLVDPIDGTEQFIRGIPSCKNLLCLVDQGKPVWAMMYYFMTDELWLARLGQGVTRNAEPVLMNYRPLERAWLDINIDFRNAQHVAKLAGLRPSVAGFTVMRDTRLLVGGQIDGVVSLGDGGGPWDYAPRALFYTETGARITNIGTDNFDFHNSSYLMAHARNFDQLTALLAA